MLLIGAVATVLNAALGGFEAFKAASIYGAVVGAITALAMVSGAYAMGIKGAHYGNLIGAAIGLGVYRVVLLRLCRKDDIRINYRHAWQERRLLWSSPSPPY